MTFTHFSTASLFMAVFTLLYKFHIHTAVKPQASNSKQCKTRYLNYKSLESLQALIAQSARRWPWRREASSCHRLSVGRGSQRQEPTKRYRGANEVIYLVWELLSTLALLLRCDGGPGINLWNGGLLAALCRSNAFILLMPSALKTQETFTPLAGKEHLPACVFLT